MGISFSFISLNRKYTASGTKPANISLTYANASLIPGIYDS